MLIRPGHPEAVPTGESTVSCLVRGLRGGRHLDLEGGNESWAARLKLGRA